MAQKVIQRVVHRERPLLRPRQPVHVGHYRPGPITQVEVQLPPAAQLAAKEQQPPPHRNRRSYSTNGANRVSGSASSHRPNSGQKWRTVWATTPATVARPAVSAPSRGCGSEPAPARSPPARPVSAADAPRSTPEPRPPTPPGHTPSASCPAPCA